MSVRRQPGTVRDAIVAALEASPDGATVGNIVVAVRLRLGDDVSESSIRSYLRLNVPKRFIRAGRGYYRLTSSK